MLEGRVNISSCGCWIIYSVRGESVLRFKACSKHTGQALDNMEKMLYLDKVGSVSASVEVEEQLWLT